MSEHEYEDEETMPETDPATVAFLDQAEAQFATEREEFNALYGFDHDCRCSQDYTDGRMAEVTQCFLKLTSDALARCFNATYELRVYHELTQELAEITNGLMKLLVDLGHKGELEEFLRETQDLDEQDVSELEDQLTIDLDDPSDAEETPDDTGDQD